MKRRKPINILFILPNFDTGGSEKLVFDLIASLDKTKFQPVLTVFFTGSLEKEFRKLNLPFYVIHQDGIRSKFSVFSSLREIALKHDIDLVNTHHASPLIQGIAPLKLCEKLPMIHVEHTRLDLDPNTTPKSLFIEKLFLTRVDAVVGASPSACDYFRTKLNVPANKVHYISNGIDLKRYCLSDFNRKEYREKLGLEENSFALGLFANFRKQKNHACLIHALRILQEKGEKDIQLLLCGSGPLEDKIMKLVDEKNLKKQVIFLGPRYDIPQLMQSIDCFCLPSYFEGLPFSLLEAMAAQAPIIATDVIGNNELITHNQNGLLVKDNSPNDLANAIVQIKADHTMRERISKTGRKSVENYSKEKMIAKYEELFLRIAKGQEYEERN